MSPSMSDGFKAGAGVDPALLKATVLAIGVGVAVSCAAWLVLQLIVAYRDEQITAAQTQLGIVKVAIACLLLVFFLSSV